MKNLICLLLILLCFSNLKAQLPPFPPSVPNTDSTSFYLPDGTKNWFYYQKDVAVFRMGGGAKFTDTLPAFVKSIHWDVNDPNGYNIILFDTAAPNALSQAYWYYIHGYTGFEYGFIPTTKNRYANASDNLWYMGDDLLLVQFKDTAISPAAVSGFMSRNLLSLYSKPDSTLPHPGAWSWIFRMLEDQRFTPFDAASRIWYNEQALVYACEPDMTMSRSFDGDDVGIKENEISFQNLKVYPNPTKDKLNIELEDQQNVSLSITNTLGQIVFTQKEIDKAIEIGFLTSGVYYLRLENKTGFKVVKILKN